MVRLRSGSGPMYNPGLASQVVSIICFKYGGETVDACAACMPANARVSTGVLSVDIGTQIARGS